MTKTITGYRFQGSLRGPILHDGEVAVGAFKGHARQPSWFDVRRRDDSLTIRNPTCAKDLSHVPPVAGCSCGLYAWTHRSPWNAQPMHLMSCNVTAMLLEVTAEVHEESWTDFWDERRTSFRAAELRVVRVWGGPWAARRIAPEWWPVPFQRVPRLRDVVHDVIPELVIA